jgi:hypothetical protein
VAAAAEIGDAKQLDGKLYEITGFVRIQGLPRPPTTQLTLNGGQYYAMTRQDGSFVFHNIPKGKGSFVVSCC